MFFSVPWRRSFALVLPVLALADSPPWDVLGTRTIVTPFLNAGLYSSRLAPNGDVVMAGSSCRAPGIQLTGRFGDTSRCGLIVARVTAAGNFAFAVQLGDVDYAGTLLIDSDGNIFVSGEAESSRFLTTPGAYLEAAPQSAVLGNYSANFACKLSSSGTPVFCTFLDDTAALVTLDRSGGLLFTKSIAASSTLSSVVRLNSSGAKVLESVPINGTIAAIAPNPDGTFYLSGRTPPPQPAAFYGKFDPAAGFLFTQYFGPTGGFSISLQASGGPILAGNFGSGFSVRQYASDGTTVVYEQPLPSISTGALSTMDGGVLLTANSNAGLPLLHNLHVCKRLLAPGTVDSAALIRLDSYGAIVQSTFLDAVSAGSLVHMANGGWSALGKVNEADSFPYAPNAIVQVLSLGPTPSAQPMPIGCLVDLAEAVRSVASPGLLVAINIETDAAAEPLSANPDSAGRFPASLGGMAIAFDGVPAPLFALAGQRLTGAVPFSVAGRSTAQMCLISSSAPQGCTAIQVLPLSPAVWSVAGAPAVINQDGTLNSADHPAPPGSVVTFYMIGLGPLSPGVPDGTIVGPPLPALATQVQVQLFTRLGAPTYPAEVTYAGPATFEVAGVYQVNARLPSQCSESNGCPGSVRILVGPLDAPVAGAVTSINVSKAPLGNAN
jgi:uncharacterized protein (TIGR03437 family)